MQAEEQVVARTGKILRSLVGEKIVVIPEMYGDGDLSLTSTPLIDERIPSPDIRHVPAPH